MKRRCAFTFFGLGVLLMSLLNVAMGQQLTCLAEVATGEGTLTSQSGEKLRINAVAVFLRENGEAEIWLMTAKDNVYAGGRWLRGGSSSRAVDLLITDDTEGGCATGCGTVLLQDGCVPVASLNLVVSMTDGTRFEAEFIAKNPEPCSTP